jgi:hypothetical protein
LVADASTGRRACTALRQVPTARTASIDMKPTGREVREEEDRITLLSCSRGGLR